MERSASSSRRVSRGARERVRRGLRRCGCWAPILATGNPSSCTAGVTGPYVKHGAINATLPDRDAADVLTLEQAVALVDAKAGRAGPASRDAKPARSRSGCHRDLEVKPETKLAAQSKAEPKAAPGGARYGARKRRLRGLAAGAR